MTKLVLHASNSRSIVCIRLSRIGSRRTKVLITKILANVTENELAIERIMEAARMYAKELLQAHRNWRFIEHNNLK